METIRAFLAIEINDEVRSAIAKWLKQISERIRGVRWIVPENWHLTLRFLGDVSPETLEEVKRVTAEVAAGLGQIPPGPPFSKGGILEAVGTGIFQSLARPRVAWIGSGGDVAILEKLMLPLSEGLAELDVKPEETRRGFHPHITVGRIKNPKKALGLEQWLLAGKDKSFGTFPLEAVTLFKSELTSQGARYSRLGQFRLGG